MKALKHIFLLVAMLAFHGTMRADNVFFFKGGGGLGYDSNVLASDYPYQSLYAKLSLTGQYDYTGDGWKFYSSASADSDIYDVFLYLNAGITAGAAFSFQSDNQLKLQASYGYSMDINQLAVASCEFSQDIADFSTIKAGYDFSVSLAAAGVTNSQYVSHNASLAYGIDLGTAGYVDFSVRDRYTVYPWVLYNGMELRNNGIFAGAQITLIPGPVFEIQVGGQYAYHDSFTTNLTLFPDTNDISLFNTSSVYEANAGVKINWSAGFITGLYAQYDWTVLTFQNVTQSDLLLKAVAEYYVSESLKLELPATYTLKISSLTGTIGRWKFEGNIYYLF